MLTVGCRVVKPTWKTFGPNSTEYIINRAHVIEPKIKFDYRTSEVLEESYYLLDFLASFMNENPTYVVEVGEHDDTRKNPAVWTKSSKRATKVVNYLISKGIDRDRLVAKGYGTTTPLITLEEIEKMKSDKDREDAHALNLRTELKVLRLIEN